GGAHAITEAPRPVLRRPQRHQFAARVGRAGHRRNLRAESFELEVADGRITKVVPERPDIGHDDDHEPLAALAQEGDELPETGRVAVAARAVDEGAGDFVSLPFAEFEECFVLLGQRLTRASGLPEVADSPHRYAK